MGDIIILMIESYLNLTKRFETQYSEMKVFIIFSNAWAWRFYGNKRDKMEIRFSLNRNKIAR